MLILTENIPEVQAFKHLYINITGVWSIFDGDAAPFCLQSHARLVIAQGQRHRDEESFGKGLHNRLQPKIQLQSPLLL